MYEKQYQEASVENVGDIKKNHFKLKVMLLHCPDHG